METTDETLNAGPSLSLVPQHSIPNELPLPPSSENWNPDPFIFYKVQSFFDENGNNMERRTGVHLITFDLKMCGLALCGTCGYVLNLLNKPPDQAAEKIRFHWAKSSATGGHLPGPSRSEAREFIVSQLGSLDAKICSKPGNFVACEELLFQWAPLAAIFANKRKHLVDIEICSECFCQKERKQACCMRGRPIKMNAIKIAMQAPLPYAPMAQVIELYRTKREWEILSLNAAAGQFVGHSIVVVPPPPPPFGRGSMYPLPLAHAIQSPTPSLFPISVASSSSSTSHQMLLSPVRFTIPSTASTNEKRFRMMPPSVENSTLSTALGLAATPQQSAVIPDERGCRSVCCPYYGQPRFGVKDTFATEASTRFREETRAGLSVSLSTNVYVRTLYPSHTPPTAEEQAESARLSAPLNMSDGRDCALSDACICYLMQSSEIASNVGMYEKQRINDAMFSNSHGKSEDMGSVIHSHGVQTRWAEVTVKRYARSLARFLKTAMRMQYPGTNNLDAALQTVLAQSSNNRQSSASVTSPPSTSTYVSWTSAPGSSRE